MDLTSIVSLVLNLAFGGGLIASLVTMKSTKKKAAAEAKTTELDNVQEAVKIWREMAEGLKAELESQRQGRDGMLNQIDLLRKEVQRLTRINQKMVTLLDKITPENLEQMVDQIKKMHENNG